MRAKQKNKTNYVDAHARFKAEVHVLTREEGGRRTPFCNNYRAQFYFRTADITGSIKLPKGIKAAKPGRNLIVETTLTRPIVMKPGLPFVIREGNRMIGTGVVANILT